MNCSSTIVISPYQSPCGQLVLGEWGGELCLCDWNVRKRREVIACRLLKHFQAVAFEWGDTPLLRQAASQLDEYFKRKRLTFNLPLRFAGTPFQKRVWHSLLGIDYGHTLSYSQLSESVEHPKAIRAVASAVGANAMSIVVPCHRVIGADGSLTGYAGGLPAKRYLLDLERLVQCFSLSESF